MSTSDLASNPAAPPHARLVDARLLKQLVIVSGLVPLVLLGWDAAHHALGVNEVDFAIHTTGMTGLVLLLLALVVTPLRRLTGWNVVIAARRPLGLLAFLYLVVHLGIFYVLDRAGSVSSTVHEILSRTYLQLGAIALFLMAALAATSTDAMVLRLGARRWKLLHRLVYPIAILGVIHFWLQVKSDIRLPRAFAVALGALLLFRVGRAVVARREAPAPRPRRFWSGELRVDRIVDETPDVKTFRLVPPGGGPLPFAHRPGQYLNLRLEVDGRRVSRSYTIASPPGRSDACEITVRRIDGGAASTWLHDRLGVGDRLAVSAPAGRFVFTGEEADRVLLVAGGVGITPIMSVVRYLADRSWPGRIDLVLSFRTRADVVFAEELARLERSRPNLHVAITLTRPSEADAWDGETGRISAEMLARLVPDLANAPVLLCGPEPMMAATREVLEGLGVAPERIATEEFVSPPDGAPAEADAGPGAIPAAGAGVRRVRFGRSDRTVDAVGDETLLECAEDAGVPIPFECRSGICGQCRTRLLSGRVAMEAEDALSPADRERGLILMCQARPLDDVTIDA